METKLNINIHGMDFNVVSDNSLEFITKVSSYVNNKMDALSSQNIKLPTSTVAILTALNIAEDLFLEKESADRIREEIPTYAMDVNKYKAQMLEYKGENELLVDEIETLKIEQAMLKNEIETLKKRLNNGF